MKISIDKAVKSMLTAGIRYDRLYDYARMAIHSANLMEAPPRARDLLVLRLMDDGITGVNEALLTLVLHHAGMAATKTNGKDAK